MNEGTLYILSPIDDIWASNLLSPVYKNLQYWRETEATGRDAPVVRTEEGVAVRPNEHEQVSRIRASRETTEGARTRTYAKEHEAHGAHEASYPSESDMHTDTGIKNVNTVHTLEKAAEFKNRELDTAHAPARYCVFEKDNRLYVDVAFLDSQGHVKSDKIYPLSDYNVTYWLERFRSAKGLLVNKEG